MIYDRTIFKRVIIYHPKVDIAHCLCGWSKLGALHADHAADVYEEAVRKAPA